MTGSFDLGRWDIAAAMRPRAGASGRIDAHLHPADPALVSDEMVARVRGPAYAIAGELLEAMAEAGPGASEDPQSPAFASAVERLGEMLLGLNALREHLHGLAIEIKTSERLAEQAGIDPVVPPFLAAMTEVNDAAVALSAAEVRFLHDGRRMATSFAELPRDLRAMALAALRALASQAGQDADAAARQAELALHTATQTPNRLDLLEQLADAAIAAGEPLTIEHAGVALFLTQLARLGGERREAVSLSLVPSRTEALGALLATAGLTSPEVAAQLRTLHPGMMATHQP